MTDQPIPRTSREDIAANVRAALARAQIEQQTVAAKLGKSPSAISDRVNGETHFRVDELQVVAALCGVTLDDLLRPADQAAHR